MSEQKLNNILESECSNNSEIIIENEENKNDCNQSNVQIEQSQIQNNNSALNDDQQINEINQQSNNSLDYSSPFHLKNIWIQTINKMNQNKQKKQSYKEQMYQILEYFPNPKKSYDKNNNNGNIFYDLIQISKKKLIHYQSYQKDENQFYHQVIKQIREYILVSQEFIDKLLVNLRFSNRIQKDNYLTSYEKMEEQITKCDELKQNLDELKYVLIDSKIQKNLTNLKIFLNQSQDLNKEIQVNEGFIEVNNSNEKLQKQEAAQKNQENFLKKFQNYGFNTIEQLQNFSKALNNFDKRYFQETIHEYQNILSLIQYSLTSLNKCIEDYEFGLKFLKVPSLNLLIKHYSQLDRHIKQTDLCYAKKKILFLTDNSSYFFSEMNDCTKTYEEIISIFPLDPILETYQETNQFYINKIFKKNIQFEIPCLKQPIGISVLKRKIEYLESKIESQQKQIEYLELKVLSEQNENKQEKLHKKIEEIKEKIEEGRQIIDNYQERHDDLQENYEEINEIQIRIAKMIYHGFRKAIQQAVKWEESYSLKVYLKNMTDINSAIQNY